MTSNGLGASSQILTGLSILIAGKNTFGYTGDGTKSPAVEFNTVDEASTGIVKPLKMTLEVENLDVEFLTHIFTGLPFVLKGNINDDGKNIPYLITAQGEAMKIETTLKSGDKVKRSFELTLSMYSEIVNNVPTIVYIKHPYSCILGGVDTAPNFSDNL